MWAGPEAVMLKARPGSLPPRRAGAGSSASQAAVCTVRGAEPRPSGRVAPPRSPSLPAAVWLGAARGGGAGESYFPTSGSVPDWAGRQRMEVGLSAFTLYLASASSRVAASTMDREPVSRAEGEAVAASGAVAAAAVRDSAPQVGEAA